jgi:class 3 adenylate cyclase
MPAPPGSPRVRHRTILSALAAAAVLLGLPLAVWLDLRGLSDRSLLRQAEDMTRVITSMRAYYSANVVDRITSAGGGTEVRHDYIDHPGAIPIPATLSIELGTWIAGQSGGVSYRFVSDLPFARRSPHDLSPLETAALARFRASRDPADRVAAAAGGALARQVTLVTPVMMDRGCVACHNGHPESPKRDWAIGDVRGLQVVEVGQPIAPGIAAFRWLLAYFALAAAVVTWLVLAQGRLTRSVLSLNETLAARNAFLAEMSDKLAKYLSPQIFRLVFSGAREATVASERKKLTVFMADIVDFTLGTETLQPEETTALLNEYFTEMSRIATRHGATIDKFIGDAMVAFFGDPETRGVQEDARACVRMAVEMQWRLIDLAREWQARGIAQPFRVRMGVHTGFCTVGNFGSEARMAYTIIGAEANLAARLQALAPPGGIVLSFETWSLVRDMVPARRLPDVRVKGIARPVTPYLLTAEPEAPATPAPAPERTRISPLPL